MITAMILLVHKIANPRISFGKTKIIYSGFKGISLLERHRMIYDVLNEEMKSIIHALSIEAKYES